MRRESRKRRKREREGRRAGKAWESDGKRSRENHNYVLLGTRKERIFIAYNIMRYQTFRTCAVSHYVGWIGMLFDGTGLNGKEWDGTEQDGTERDGGGTGRDERRPTGAMTIIEPAVAKMTLKTRLTERLTITPPPGVWWSNAVLLTPPPASLVVNTRVMVGNGRP